VEERRQRRYTVKDHVATHQLSQDAAAAAPPVQAQLTHFMNAG